MNKPPIEWRCRGCRCFVAVESENTVNCSSAQAVVIAPLVADHPRYEDCQYRCNDDPSYKPLDSESLLQIHTFALSLRDSMDLESRVTAVSDFEAKLRAQKEGE